ncbi:hypothetical protein [Dyadobacter sp. CY312]|uniref:hypothetical protein n=1 Tax=Dyadobacter sp. CY312 TaxID=2907303 RepID=UPI001F41C195|nr:hypothetical protein [Dyadobacter sp. CY312]MCE7039206.1 hypothetical protein [Dyadobacter sp. CY312]
MSKGYFVYSGVEHFDEPVASFSTLENAIELSKRIGSHSDPTEINGEIPIDIDKYLPQLEAGLSAWDIALLGDGTIFEIDNGLEIGSVLLSDPVYSPQHDTFTGTFWAFELEDAIENARNQLNLIKQQNGE